MAQIDDCGQELTCDEGLGDYRPKIDKDIYVLTVDGQTIGAFKTVVTAHIYISANYPTADISRERLHQRLDSPDCSGIALAEYPDISVRIERVKVL